MHDIDSQIAKISGQQDYMKQLEKITGNIFFIDMTMYHEKHRIISDNDEKIRQALTDINASNEAVHQHLEKYVALSSALDVKNKTFVMKVKKSKKSKKKRPPREVVNNGYLPQELIKTEWFKCIKHLERDINKFFTEVFPLKQNENDTNNTHSYTLLEQIYKEHPELTDIKLALDCQITNENIFNNIFIIRQSCKEIIDILLLPMYDVKRTIVSHSDKLDTIFKTKAFQNTQIASMDDIIEILYQFIVAKYRATVTGNDKHYVKLFLDTLGNEQVSNMDGARFIEIMDAIDLDKLDKRDRVYQFAINAKKAINHIANNDNISPEIIAEFEAMFGRDEEPNTSHDGQLNEQYTDQHTDLLNEQRTESRNMPVDILKD